MSENNLLFQKCDRPQNFQRAIKQRTKLIVSVLLFSLLLWLNVSASRVFGALKNRHGSFTVISAKPCQNALGQVGTCMFMWDCIKSEGIHLGTCSDRFLFGSCCHHNSSLTESQPIKPNRTSPSVAISNSQDSITVQAIQSSALESSNSSPHLASTSGTVATPAFPDRPAPHTRPFLQSTSNLSLNRTDVAPTQSLPNKAANGTTSHPNVDMNSDILKQFTNLRPNSTVLSDSQEPNQSVVDTKAHNASNAQAITNEASPPMNSSSFQIATHSNSVTPTRVDESTNNQLSSNAYQVHNSSHSVSNDENTNGQQASPFSNQFLLTKPAHQTPASAGLNAIYMNPLAPSQDASANLMPTQQGKPQAVSWLSRPGIIANAIFHSFKPYLNPNRHRPTYKPYIGVGYRPQHYRPMAPEHGNQQKPAFSLFGLQQPPQQQPSNTFPTHRPLEVSSLDAPSQASPSRTTTTVGPDNDGQTSNNDHHIVNPSTAIMTDRHRPIDKNTYGASGGSSHHIQKQGQLELASNSSVASYSVTAANASSVDQMIQVSSAGYGGNRLPANVINYEPLTNQLPLQQQQHSNAFNFNQLQPVSFNQNSSDQIYSAPSINVSLPISTQSNQYPAYPMISSLPNHIASLPSSSTGSIDEIHGLSTVGGPQLENSNTSFMQTSPEMVTPTPALSLGTIQLTGFSQAKPSESIYNNLGPETTSLPPGTVLIGNIDESPMITSPVSSLEVESEGSHSASSLSTATPISNVIHEPPSMVKPQSTPPMASVVSSTIATTTLPVASESPQSSGDSGKRGNTNGDTQVKDPNHKEVACGMASMYPQTKVVGGKNAAFGAWPWQVSVRKVSFFGFSSTHRCGGAVISSEWIATAGHCVEDLALQSIRIRVGEYDFSSMSEPHPHIERAARRKVVHPKYNFYTYENDLALVQLDQPLQFPPHVAPICLPPDNIDLLGRNATVTGWGRLNEGGTLPTILQEVRVPIVSNDKCKDMFLNAGRPEYIPDIFLCAGYEEGGRDSCQGDSGGPLQVRGDDGKWFLAGIISWGIGCAEQNLPGVCTRISRFKLWIQSTMSSNG